MYQTACPNVSLDSSNPVHKFDCLSSSGQSGSPVWTYEQATGDRAVRGIGIANSGSSSGAAPGTFLLITNTIYFDINRMMSGS